MTTKWIRGWNRVLVQSFMLAVWGSSLSLVAWAQSPTSLSVFPSTIYRAPATSSCYTITVGNGANMTVDTRYRFNNGPEETLYGWPDLNASGQAFICTDTATPTGVYTFTGVRRTATEEAFLPVNVQITVLPSPPQPTTLTFNGSTSGVGYAGDSTYTLHANGVVNGSIDIQYEVIVAPGQQPIPPGTVTIPLDANGNWTYTLGHYETIGEWRFSKVRNTQRSDWANIASSYTIRPPKPKSLSITPSSVVAGQGAYRMTVGNGANVTMDVRYTLDPGTGEASAPDIFGWPFLSPISTGSPDGYADIQVGSCTKLGTYRFKFVENTLNPDTWQPVNAATGLVTVTTPAGPTVTSRQPAAGLAGTTGSFTLNGTNLCGVTLSTTYTGLSFGSIPDVNSSTGTSVTTTFSIASNAQPGTATVFVNARGGSTSFAFSVSSAFPPTITGFNPTSAAAGAATTVTLAGTNLVGATLSSSTPGITFDNVTHDNSGTSMSARFTITPSTLPGNVAITATTPAGSASRDFGITAGGSGAITSSKEYIYLGNRLLAVETASNQPAPPTSPSPLTATAVNANTVDLAWHPSTVAPGFNLAYEVRRGTAVIQTITAPVFPLAFRDQGVAQHTSYSYTVVARDNWPQSTTSNSVTITTPWETIPPSVPQNVVLSDSGEMWCVVSWSPSTDSGGSGLAGYYLAFAGGEPFSGLIPAGQTEFGVDFNWWPGWNGEGLSGFDVYAVDNAGNVSAPGTLRW